jgi:hypothetical protein
MGQKGPPPSRAIGGGLRRLAARDVTVSRLSSRFAPIVPSRRAQQGTGSSAAERTRFMKSRSLLRLLLEEEACNGNSDMAAEVVDER